MTTPIDPEVKLFVDGVAAAYGRYPNVMKVPYDQGRAIVEQVRKPWRKGGPVMVSVEDRVVALPNGSLHIRIHRPTAAQRPAVLIYLHGGGFTFFSIDTHDRVMREYAARAGVTVVGVDYPLSPEHKFPVALERIAALAEWLEEQGPELNIDPARIAIGGDSAGGNLSVATALLLRDKGKPGLIKAMVLNYAGLSPNSSDEAKRTYGGPGAILTAEEADFFWGNYVRGAEDRKNPLAHVLSADPKGLPPAIFVVAENDLLAEQSPMMAQRMIAAGGSAVVKSYPGAVHGFIEAVSVSKLAAEALQDGSDWLKQTLAR